MDEELNNVSAGLYREVLDRGQDLDIKVGGSSMWPFIKEGETLALRKTSFDDINRGDVIATYDGQRLMCHRVFKKGRDFIRTKADALVGLDARIGEGEILGKVVAQKRNGRIRRCDGRMSSRIGSCIVWATFVWAPMIPVFRRIKKILTE